MVRQKQVNIVVPTIRDISFFSNFLENWGEEFEGCNLIVVEDRKKKILNSLLKEHSKFYGYTYQLFDWRDIDKDLGEDSWIIPRQTDVVRNYGYLVAYRNDPLFILTLDDDTAPGGDNYILTHYNNLFLKKGQYKYFSTMPGKNVRGSEAFVQDMEIGVSHSGWLKNPDYSAHEQVRAKVGCDYASYCTDFYNGVVPTENYYAMCGMALAWKPELTKWMYFPMQGLKDWGIDRCGDIWAGFYCKEQCDWAGIAHHTGEPFVLHERASNIWSSIVKEEDSDKKGDAFIYWLETGEKKPILKDYLDKLEEAYEIWERLLDEPC